MSRLNSAGSSITDLIGVMPSNNFLGCAVPIWPFPELGAEVFKNGEMVSLSGSAGNAVGITKPGTDASGYGILGFAADAASGAISSFKGVYVAHPGQLFQANVGHSTSANAQTAALDLGQRYGLTSLSGRTYVDKSKTAASTTMVRVVGFNEQDAVPSFFGRVIFTVNPERCQMWTGYLVSTSAPASVV